MTPLELAEEIINGRRIKRQDDLTFFQIGRASCRERVSY